MTMCQHHPSTPIGDRRTIRGMTLDSERALYGLMGADVEDCVFSGPADGESALKECSDVAVRGCSFDLRYPLWHARRFSLEDSSMSGTCRAALWYDTDDTVSRCDLGGPKALRECSGVSLEMCGIDSVEFGWKCRGIRIRDCSLTSEYPFLDSSDLEIDGLRMDAKYSFQYTTGLRIRDSVLNTKDAFWHSRDVTVEDSVLNGEYLGWYSEGLTSRRCRIVGTQPLCYCRDLRLVDCVMEGTDLAFEYSDVDATVIGHIDSVKNPRSGTIRAGSIGEVVTADSVMGCSCDIVTDDERARGPGGRRPFRPSPGPGRPNCTSMDIARHFRDSLSNPQIPTAVLSQHGFRVDVLPVLREGRRSQRPDEVRVPELRQVHLQGPHRHDGVHTSQRDRGPLQGGVCRGRGWERQEGHGHRQRPGREHRLLRP